MTMPRARIVRATDVTLAAPVIAVGPSERHRVRIAREELEARAAAERVLAAAQAEAAELLARAREDAAREAERAARDARERAAAEGAAAWLALRREEALRLERDGERVVAVAVVLAERLLGAALEIDPRRIRDLARMVIAEARGARRVVIEAHRLDVDALRAELAAVAGVGVAGGMGGLGASAVQVRAAEGLARGDLRLQTDGGTIDARLTLRLERLAAALRDALPG
ncbi:MAG: hypothetical protein JOZ69_04695 [Myxococcales bacterium]|nr:hypothetical protein [Myxococcales bacterium]